MRREPGSRGSESLSDLIQKVRERSQFVSEAPEEMLSEQERLNKLAVEAGMQAGPMVGPLGGMGVGKMAQSAVREAENMGGRFGQLRNMLGSKAQPVLREAEAVSPNLGKLEQAPEVLKETIMREMGKKGVPSDPRMQVNEDVFNRLKGLMGK